jgi:hypothetical protein
MANDFMTAQPYFDPSKPPPMPSFNTSPTNFGGFNLYQPYSNDFLSNFKVGGQASLDKLMGQTYTPGGQDTFRQAITASSPSAGISPETQQVLDIIRKNQDYSSAQGASQAQALASRRGLAGSSVEQFGTQSANEAASRAGQDATASVLNQYTQQQAAMKQLQAQGLFQRSGQELQGSDQLQQTQNQALITRMQQEGTLSSDEIASLRNMSYANQSLALQSLLGQEGLDISRQNIGVSQDIANQQSRNQLLGLGSNLLAPYVLPRMFGSAPGAVPGTGAGSGTGFLSSLFGGGGSSTFTGTAAPNAGAGSTLFPGGIGPVGTGTSASGFPLGGGAGFLPNLGAGALGYGVGHSVFGSTQPGDQAASNIYSGIGAVGGSLFGPVGTGVGAALGYGYGKGVNRLTQGAYNSLGNTGGSIVKAVINPIGSTIDMGKKAANVVKNVFPF